MLIVIVFWYGAQGQGPTNKTSHELGDYFLNFVCLGDLIDLAQLNNKKLNERVKYEETLGI